MTKAYNLAIKLQRALYKNKAVFMVSKADQKRFLNGLRSEEDRFEIDDIERSFLQFKCQVYLDSRWKYWVINIVSSAAIFPTIVYLLCQKLPSEDVSGASAINLGMS